jgi:SsrA-binding protein
MLSRMALVKNRKATFNYEVLEKYEAGIELRGFEVKALRAGKGKLEGAHVVVRGDEAFLVGAQIPAFQPKNAPKDYDPERTRRLLLNRKELNEMIGIETSKGFTLVPISLYTKGRNIKLEFASVRGKKKFDKREAIKERETKIKIDRLMKQRSR